jgi:hypothetical protein
MHQPKIKMSTIDELLAYAATHVYCNIKRNLNAELMAFRQANSPNGLPAGRTIHCVPPFESGLFRPI